MYITTIPALGSKHTKNKWGGDAGSVTNLKTRHFSRFTLFDQLLMAFRSGTIGRNFWSLFTAHQKFTYGRRGFFLNLFIKHQTFHFTAVQSFFLRSIEHKSFHPKDLEKEQKCPQNRKMRGTFFRGTNFMLISPPSLKYVTPIPSSLCEVSDPHKRINLLKYSNKRYQMIKYLLLTHRRMGSLCVKRRENDCTIPVTYCSPQLHVNIVILLHQD